MIDAVFYLVKLAMDMNPMMADETEVRRQQREHEQQQREQRAKQIEKVRLQIFQSAWKTFARLIVIALLVTAFYYHSELQVFASANINQVVYWMKNLGTPNNSQPAGHLTDVSQIVQ